jgi:hypothetical protein
MPKVKGVVDRIWTNKTGEGKRYNVLEIAGERYSLWDGEQFEKIKEGQEIEFDYKVSGKFKNISMIYDGSENEPGNGNGRDLDNATGYNGDGIDRMADNQRIVRLSCVKSASNLFQGSRIPFEERADRTLEVAKRFENYIYDERVLDEGM